MSGSFQVEVILEHRICPHTHCHGLCFSVFYEYTGNYLKICNVLRQTHSHTGAYFQNKCIGVELEQTKRPDNVNIQNIWETFSQTIEYKKIGEEGGTAL